MTIINEIDLKFKSGNAVQVQDVRLTREEWVQVKAYIDGLSVKQAARCSTSERDLYAEIKEGFDALVEDRSK